ncbi:MAG TPA: hypothetical protein VL689_05670 [Paraburkholderia sp.]|jgi:hypothetical protein|nr:hypothetical protein [Paraburkholderia sp.]
MSRYPVHTIDSALSQSKPVLEKLRQTFGALPNIAATTAASPVLIHGFIGLFQRVHASRLTEPQIQTLLLTNAVTNARARRLVDELLAYPDAPRDWKRHPGSSAVAALPFVPLGFVKDGVVLRYFSLVTTVGTPQTVAAQELRVERLFPADDDTEARRAQLLAASPHRSVPTGKP